MVPVPVHAARTTLTQIMTSLDVNLLGTVHGGVVMRMVDSVAGAVAGRHSAGPAVTVSMDEMVFLRPVRVGDLVHAHAQVNWAGRTSMEVGVRVTSERWNEIDPPVHVASAYLVFVAVDERRTGHEKFRRSSPKVMRIAVEMSRPASGGSTDWPVATRSTRLRAGEP